MKMPGQNEAALNLLRVTLDKTKIKAEKKKMFGHETYFLKSYMFAGVFGDDIFVQVGLETVEANQKTGFGYFEPMGKRMRNYITLKPAAQNNKNVSTWLKKGATFVAKLPAKDKGKASKKK